MSVKVRLDKVEKTLTRGVNDTTLALNQVSLEIERGELFFLLVLRVVASRLACVLSRVSISLIVVNYYLMMI